MQPSIKRRLGQNTAEYLIMLVLIAGASIGLFSIFGTTLRQQMGNVVAAFSGTSDGLTKQATIEKNGKLAKGIVGKKVTMSSAIDGDSAVPKIEVDK